ncbi:hypothetical protein D3C78_1400880 [compost metagenome]
MALRPKIEALLTMAPPPLCSMAAISYFIMYRTPLRLMSMTSEKSSTGVSCTSLNARCRPALLKAPSRRPKACMASATSASQSAGLATSVARNAAWPPAATISSTTARPASALRLPITTRAPARASARLASRPMPLPPPVTMTTRPSS